MRTHHIFALTICLVSGSVNAADQILTFTGLGAVRIGMTVAEAEASLRTKLKPFDPGDRISRTVCWLTERADESEPWITYMVQNGKIVRIDVWQDERGIPPVRTERGIALGAVEQAILEKHGPALKAEYHNSLGTSGYYARVLSDDGKHGLLFETAHGSLVNMRSGLLDAIELSETCL